MFKTALIPIILLTVVVSVIVLYQYQQSQAQIAQLNSQIKNLKNDKLTLSSKMSSISGELNDLKNQDQIKINLENKTEIKNIEDTYKKSITTYQNLQDLKVQEPKLDKKFDALMAQAINELANKNFSSASADLNSLNSLISSESQKFIDASTPPPTAAPANNTPPGSGFSRQTVHTDRGDFVVDIIAAELGSAKAIVDTASDSTCANNCPTLSLGEYVARNGAFAGVNGSYFCPTDYPSCAGKTNSFDLLAMNKNKHYLNSDNNVYSTNPAVIFGSGWVRFVDHAQDWGRDTSVDGVLSNYPLLLSGHNIRFSDAGDAKMSVRGNRSFVASIGNKVFIGVNHNVTVAESAIVLKAMGMENAMNLDSGGSTALWFGGYKDGPGRNLPNVILFVRK